MNKNDEPDRTDLHHHGTCILVEKINDNMQVNTYIGKIILDNDEENVAEIYNTTEGKG